ncbi:MAG: zinc ribbon domain-containing protein [Thaumarchaeota archaeon]|nr:zinc ribbon domain-containing protein [Nitrososphaerota archaeon]
MTKLEKGSTKWHEGLIEDLETLSLEKYHDIPFAMQTIDDLVQSLEEEWSKNHPDFKLLADCPRCGNERKTTDNFCPRCGYENGFCQHDETGYDQGSRIFCLKCKKKLLTNEGVIV